MERDDHGDGGVREGARGESGGAGGEPGDRLGTTQQVGQGPEHDDGDRRLGDVEREVEGDLQGRGAAMDGHRGEAPTTFPATSATGAARKSPTTSGISLREIVRP